MALQSQMQKIRCKQVCNYANSLAVSFSLKKRCACETPDVCRRLFEPFAEDSVREFMRSCVCRSFASKPRSAMARTATTAMAARWDAGGQITMGAAGRDRRVRAEPKIRTKKSRQPGAREEESHDEKEVVKKRPASALQEHFENRALVSSSSVPARPYTDPRQESPDRKRGRQATLSRSSLWTRFSLDGILASNPAEIVEICLEVGILKDGRLDPCEWCEKTNWRIESKKDHAAYRCKTKDCRSSKSVLSHDLDLFNKKLALRSLIGALWLFLSPLNVSPDQAGLVLGVDNRTVRDLFVSFRKWLTPIVDRLNEELIIGGAGNDVELDEVSFRSKGLDDKDLCQNFIWFSRFTWLLGTSK